MATKGKTETEKELWQALEGLDADLLDPGLPESVVDDELKALGVDPLALAKRASEFVAVVKEEERLSWLERTQQNRARLEALAAGSKANVPSDMGRRAMLLRLDELRRTDPNVGTAIKMAARKRKPEESTDDELRALLEEMEALRAIEGSGRE
jgi:hypothetical protein